MAEGVATRASVKTKKRQRVMRKRSTLILILAVGGLLALAGGWLLWSGQRMREATIDFTPEDVAHDVPITAVHEMGSGRPIPFLPGGGPQPAVAVSEQYHDFGSLGPSEVVTREFVIANTGEAPLTISRAYTTCGCTTADFTSAVIPPGKVSIMTLRFDAGFHDVRGETVRRGVIIENNDPDRSTVEIWVEARIRTTP